MTTENPAKFINSLFLKDFVERQYNETDVKILNYGVEPVNAKNFNDAKGRIQRVLVSYSSKKAPVNTTSAVLKIKSTDPQKFESFDKEASIYKSILPSFVDNWKKVGETIEFAPRLIVSQNEPKSFMIFEDVSNHGFFSEEPSIGLNLEQSKISLQKLAFVHATSVINLSKKPEDFGQFNKSIFNKDNKMVQSYLVDAFQFVLDNLETLGIEGSIGAKLKTLSSPLISTWTSGSTESLNGFKVFNHGNFWTKNILFKYVKEEYVDAVFVDYHNGYVGSPIVDLMYFFTSSVSFDVMKEYKNELLYVYHESLRFSLEKLKYQGNVPSLSDLQLEFLRSGAIEVILSLTIGPYLRFSGYELSSIFKQSNVALNSANILKYYEPVINEQLHQFDSLGLLDWGTVDSKIKLLTGRFNRILSQN
ncbi:uncharacterized protein LOC119077688 [Bradysia coprophila]|uniref:uncharacterized protein LOC119077688 n=1 Tax=Bradysia coprophila TaxID=38358 RepID=UPI00187DC62C|nr:uncharacterized protein LOC119077688 [Bradysia coprophila]